MLVFYNIVMYNVVIVIWPC